MDDILKSFSLSGKVALVTGATYGIGFEIAAAYSRAGAKVAINGHNEERLEKAQEEYRKIGVDVRTYLCDVTNEYDVAGMVENIRSDLGVIDILVNNAGMIKRIPMCEMSVEDFREVVDVDLTAAFIMSKAVIPDMIEKGHGKIINICSMMSELGRETVSAYAAAKGGLKMLTKNIASEFGEKNIQCNGIGPAISPLPRPLRSASFNWTARSTPSTNSSAQEPRQTAGAQPRISWDRQSSSPPTPRTS